MIDRLMYMAFNTPGDLLHIVLLMLISLFCVFRVADLDWAHTFWGESVGYATAAVGAFWKAVVYGYHYIDTASWRVEDDWALWVFNIGILLILWSATCYRLKRRTDDRRAQTGDATVKRMVV